MEYNKISSLCLLSLSLPLCLPLILLIHGRLCALRLALHQAPHAHVLPLGRQVRDILLHLLLHALRVLRLEFLENDNYYNTHR